MAKLHIAHGIHLAFGLAFLALAGCAQEPTSLSVASLPPPSFNPPAIAERPAPPKATPYVPPAPRHVTPPPAPAMAGIPHDWIPKAKANHWRWIVIHHSATPSGGAAAFDKMHRAKGWDELGYHFVIGNGTDTRDGQIEVGSRWPKQKWGAHAKTADNRYNNYGIGICLVGNFDIDRPTAAQMKSLAKLVAFLMQTYHITPDRVIGHRDTKPTDCPGRNMSIALVRRMAEQVLAKSGYHAGPDTRTASSSDLLRDAK
jgi:hypothetical protein